MADYNITKSDGTPFTISTGTINNTFDIPFLGQDAINYGDDLAQANLRLLENFANTTAPSFGITRTRGQLWYDTTAITGGLNVYDGTSWDKIPLDVNVVHTSGAESIAGIKTFTSAPYFQSAGEPFTVDSTTVVTNLNATFLDGNAPTAFATAAQGILADNAEPDLGLPGVNGYVLASTTGGARSWVSLSVSSGQVDVTGPTLDTTTNVLLVDTTAAGLQDPRYASTLTFNALTGRLSATQFQGALIGNADTATTATTAATATTSTQISIASNDGSGSDTTTYPVLVAANSATDQTPHVDGGQLSYNASTGALSATSFVGSGASLTTLSAGSISTGTLAVARGGTGVTTSTGTGTAVVLHTNPVFSGGITTPGVNFAAGVALNFNGTLEAITQLHTTTGQTSGLAVKAHSGTSYDAGFNVLPLYNWEVTDTLKAEYCGHMTGQSTGGPTTLTLTTQANVDFPIGGVTTIMNADNVDFTVTEGADTQLNYIEPGTGQVDTTGGCTIEPGGMATLYRFNAAIYYIWGSEITFTP